MPTNAERLRWLRTQLWLWFLSHEPTPRLVDKITPHHRLPLVVASVYRSANVDRLAGVLAPALVAGAHVRLWALDEVHPTLDEWTVGTGPGGRFQLINKALEGAPPGHLAVIDDDMEFVTGDLLRTVQLADHLGLDLAQPAHAAVSSKSHDIVAARPLTVARRTNFVEIGPAFIASPSVRAEITPFSEETPMGWSVDTEWFDLIAEGFTLGIIDAMQIRHFGSIGANYAPDLEEIERDAVRKAQQARGIDPSDPHHVLSTIRPWRMAAWQLPCDAGRTQSADLNGRRPVQ